jgi:hypothetical protein
MVDLYNIVEVCRLTSSHFARLVESSCRHTLFLRCTAEPCLTLYFYWLLMD